MQPVFVTWNPCGRLVPLAPPVPVPGPASSGRGHGPQRSTLFALIPTTTEFSSRSHPPGAVPSTPPAVRSVTLSRLVANALLVTTFQKGLTHTPRSRLRVAVKPSNFAITGCPLESPPT